MRASGFTNDAFARIAELAHVVAGLTFPPNRQPSAEAGMRRAMSTLGIRDPLAMLRAAEVPGEARDVVLGELTVGETYFFRESAPLAVLAEEILPARATGPAGSRPLRVWSAGCASGEEPYTIAIMLRELGWSKPARIVGTDVALARLAAARRGRYTRWALRGVSEERVDRWFTRGGSAFDLDASIRDSVQFETLNLAQAGHAPIGGQFDLVLCRNVMIYFQLDTVARIAARLLDALDDDGWLVLGASDPPLGDLVECETIATANGVMYRRPGRTNAAKGSRTAAPGVRITAASVRDFPMPAVVADPAPAPLPARTPAMPALPLPVSAPVSGEGDAQCEDDLGDVSAALDALYLAADYPEVEALARRALCAAPGAADAPPLWAHWIRAVANQGRLHEAGALCARALELQPLATELHFLHATLLSEAEWHADAAIAARRAIYLDRAYVMAHLLLGDSLARTGDRAGSRLAFENVITLLANASPGQPVPGADGVPAARLRQAAEFRMREHGVARAR